MPAKKSRWQEQHAGCQETIVRQKAEIERLTHENQRLIGSLRVTSVIAILAQCPVCLAERTNGERHDDECPLGGAATA